MTVGVRRLLTVIAAALLAGCAAMPAEQSDDFDDDAAAPPQREATLDWHPALAPDTATATATAATTTWTHTVFPGKKASLYGVVQLDGRPAISAQAVSSASMLRQRVRVEAADLNRLRFAWKVPALMADADLSHRDLDDSPVRIVLAFDGDRSRFSAKNALLSELTHAFTGEPMPYATLMYVWCNRCEPGSVVINPRTDRIRKLAIESGSLNLDRWLDYERDIRADFELAFGEAPGALLAVGIMTDSDNTSSTAKAWYGPVQLVARRPVAAAAAARP